MSNALVLAPRETTAVDDVKALVNIVATLRNDVFQSNVDYGVIPGTGDKPVLLLPGMEKLMRALHLRAEYELKKVIEDFDRPLFFYRYECRLVDYENGQCVSTAIGSANSNETKWSGRWVARHQVPANLDADNLPVRGGAISEFDFAITKAETTGKYGKPAEYWQQFKDAIANGTARQFSKPTKSGSSLAWEIDATQYRIPNAEIFDQVNTIDKIAQKRALGSAIKGAANVSMFFTVDLDDFVPYDLNAKNGVPAGDVIEGETIPATNGNHAALPDASGAQWSADDAQAWAAELEKRGVSKPQLFAALGIRERYGEWTGSLDSAKARFDAWVKQQ